MCATYAHVFYTWYGRSVLVKYNFINKLLIFYQPAILPALAAAAVTAYGANKRNKDQMAAANTSYRRMAKDMEAAGLNKILAATGGFGPGAPTPNLENIFGQSATAAQAFSQTEKNVVQTKISENIEEISTQLLDAWNNSGKNVLEGIATASWEDIGKSIGKSLNTTVDEATNWAKKNFNNPIDFFKQFFKDAKGAGKAISDAVKSLDASKSTAKGLKEPTGSGRGIPEFRR
jgi:hypothetical protein